MSPAGGETALHLSALDTQSTPLLSGRRLRAHVLSRLLFFERVMLPDSPFNTNAQLRYYLWPDEPVPKGLGGGDPGPRDLAALLQAGCFVPALRQGVPSLAEVRRQHARRNVPDLPSEGFLDYVEQRVAGRYVSYDPALVSGLFHCRTMDALTACLTPGHAQVPVRRAVMQAAREYVHAQQPLYLNGFLSWIARERSDERLTERGRRFLERLARGAFRHNVAIATDSDLDIPTRLRHEPMPVELRLGSAQAARRLWLERSPPAQVELPPLVFLSERFLAEMPARLVTEIHSLPAFRWTALELRRFRDGEEIDFDAFLEQLTKYLFEVDQLVMQETSLRQREVYVGLRRRARRGAVLRLLHEWGLVALQLVVPAVAAAGSTYQIVHTGWGTARSVLSALPNYLPGYMAGRMEDRERLLLQIISR